MFTKPRHAPGSPSAVRHDDDRGATAVEYGLVIAGIGLAVMAGVALLGSSTAGTMTAAGDALTTAGAMGAANEAAAPAQPAADSEAISTAVPVTDPPTTSGTSPEAATPSPSDGSTADAREADASTKIEPTQPAENGTSPSADTVATPAEPAPAEGVPSGVSVAATWNLRSAPHTAESFQVLSPDVGTMGAQGRYAVVTVVSGATTGNRTEKSPAHIRLERGAGNEPRAGATPTVITFTYQAVDGSTRTGTLTITY